MDRGGWMPISTDQARQMLSQLTAQYEARAARALHSRWYDDRLLEQYQPSGSPFTVLVITRAEGDWHFLYRGQLTQETVRRLCEHVEEVDPERTLSLWQMCGVLDDETMRLLDAHEGE